MVIMTFTRIEEDLAYKMRSFHNHHFSGKQAYLYKLGF